MILSLFYTLKFISLVESYINETFATGTASNGEFNAMYRTCTADTELRYCEEVQFVHIIEPYFSYE